jgi:hypothetical protein
MILPAVGKVLQAQCGKVGLIPAPKGFSTLEIGDFEPKRVQIRARCFSAETFRGFQYTFSPLFRVEPYYISVDNDFLILPKNKK